MLPTWIFLEFLQHPTESVRPDENWSSLRDRTKGNNNSQPVPPFLFSFFFQWKPGECYSRRRGLQGTLCTRYASANSTKTCRRFFDFRRQGRRVGHKSDFVPACSPSSRIYPRTRCYIDASICCKTTIENIGIMRRLAACQGWSLVFPLDRTEHTLGSWMWKT